MPNDVTASKDKLVEDIHRWMSERVAQHKLLRGGALLETRAHDPADVVYLGMVFVDGIPRDAAGKILRRKLKPDLAV